jgi:hypothetical protein
MKIVEKCKHCENKFEIVKGEYLFFTKKGFKLPKLCKTCRNKRNNEAYNINGKVVDGLEYERLKNATSKASN